MISHFKNPLTITNLLFSYTLFHVLSIINWFPTNTLHHYQIKIKRVQWVTSINWETSSNKYTHLHKAMIKLQGRLREKRHYPLLKK